MLQLLIKAWKWETAAAQVKGMSVWNLQAPPLVPLVTFVLERWLGSSLDCSAPAPSVGSWV